VIAENHGGALRDWAGTLGTAHAPAPDRPDFERPLIDEPVGTVQAVQYWGRVTGQMLLDWGVDEQEIPDTARSYDAEVWLIDRWVIKALLVSDPLARRPYYGASFVNTPGRVW